MYGIKESLLCEIRNLAIKHDLSSVILFGSRCRGDYKPRSDIDLAVSGGNFDAFSLDIDEDTSTLLSFDIVNLDKPVSPELLNSIKKEGCLIYAKV